MTATTVNNIARAFCAGAVLAMLVAAPAQARCAKSDRWRICREAHTVRWTYLDPQSPSSGEVALGRRDRPARVVLGDRTGYVSVTGPRPRIVIFGGPQFAVKGEPLTLRRTGETIRWRVGEDWRRVTVATGAELPPARCKAPRFASHVSREGDSLIVDLELGMGGLVVGCVSGGRPYALLYPGDTPPFLVTARVVAFNGPFALLEPTESYRMTQRELIAYDLRTGAVVSRTSGGTEFWDGPGSTVHRAQLSPTGAVAVARDTQIVAARGVVDQVLDEAPEIDPTSLALTGTALSWRHGEEIRTAELP